MIVGIAEGQIDHGQPLEVVAHDEFVHHAHAAVHLHRMLTDQPPRLPDIGFGGGYRALPLGRILRVGVYGGDDGHRARLLRSDEHVRHLVFQRLERADRDAKLLAAS